MWAGFGAAQAQVYVGPAERHPNEAKEADWRTVFTGDTFDSLYPLSFAPHFLDFIEPVTTRAIRLRITKTTKEGHPHLKDRTKDGRRVWLGELLAFAILENNPLASAIMKGKGEEGPQPPISTTFTLKEPGYVTLVLEDAQGKRVRNLVSETWFNAGKNEVRWDGLDDLGRDPDAYKHGIYNVPGKPVAPGTYRVRGLWGPTIDLRYEFPVYTAGNPAWQTLDHTGGWLSNHTPPMSAQYVPAGRGPDGKAAIYLGSYVSEGTHGLAWVDLDGKKLGGMNWVGGVWTGAPLLARDDGPKAIPGVHVYVGSVWETEKGSKTAEARLTAITKDGERLIVKHPYEPSKDALSPQGRLMAEGEVGGLAAHNGLLYLSLRRRGEITVADARAAPDKSDKKKPLDLPVRTTAIADPRGIAIDGEGRLLVLSGTKLMRAKLVDDLKLTFEEVVTGLEDPHGVTLDPKGNIYISDWGKSH